uniref:C2 calcium dependent domain containing 4C n=1 Tax=Neogobius melanostomus TaxID=47308 RepID=A0A8C6TGC8_9GOBI
MWLLEKLRSSVERSGAHPSPHTTEAIPVAVYANVLTPQKIPDFFIPPKLICCPPDESLTRSSPRPVNTNADPQSQTAMSLPYVPKAQTSYGFSTLVESPHTRRKESLFHSDPSSPLNSPNSQRRSQGGTLLAPADSNPYRYFSGGESDTCSSAESSPFNSPLLSRSASLLRSITHETQAKVRQQPQHAEASQSLPPSPAFRGSKTGGSRGAAADLLQREHTINLHKGGTLRLSTHYDPEAARLRVRVLAAEALYSTETDVKSINCCVALYLNPGKHQKQRSTIIKNSRNPVFNEDFFFDSLPQAQVKNLAMKVKVVNKGTSLKRDVLLGEREVLLSELLLLISFVLF